MGLLSGTKKGELAGELEKYLDYPIYIERKQRKFD
jgi:hypothetical protein